jgi:flagellar biosynthetic protein FliR
VTLDAGFLFSFLLVFVRCSAMFLAAPIFGSPNVPMRIRILSAALTAALKPGSGPLPTDLFAFAASVANEVLAGLIIGVFVHIVLIGAQMGGAFMDLQVGLSMSHVMNPANGQPSTVLAQFKYMLALIVFLSVNGHHVMLSAFARSFEIMPTVSVSTLAALQENLLWLVGQLSLIALQIAAPVLAVSVLVDAALGIMNKAVPQMHIFIVGMPAKIAMGLLCVSVALPATAAAVLGGVETATDALFRVLGAKG